MPLLSGRAVLLDTQLLVLRVVAGLGRGEVERFKRTRNFTTDDAQRLEKYLQDFNQLVVTPHVVAETSNLIDWLDSSKKRAAYAHLNIHLQKAEEFYIPSKTLIANPITLKLGITDAALFALAAQHPVQLVTADLPLYHWASNHGAQVVNFHHLREF